MDPQAQQKKKGNLMAGTRRDEGHIDASRGCWDDRSNLYHGHRRAVVIAKVEKG